MLYDWEADQPDPASCQGQWREVIPLRSTGSTDTLMRCDGCGEWMVINGGHFIGYLPPMRLKEPYPPLENG